jgi:cytidine deaminase
MPSTEKTSQDFNAYIERADFIRNFNCGKPSLRSAERDLFEGRLKCLNIFWLGQLSALREEDIFIDSYRSTPGRKKALCRLMEAHSSAIGKNNDLYAVLSEGAESPALFPKDEAIAMAAMGRVYNRRSAVAPPVIERQDNAHTHVEILDREVVLDHSDKASLTELYNAVVSAKGNAYAPYSRHPVGAAIRTADGSIFVGRNVEAAHYKGLCAEASAIAGMVGAGYRKIKEIVVVGPGEHLCTPCGDCRQRIREFADAATRIHVFDRAGTLKKSYTMDQLLPDSFGPENVTEMQP